MDFIYSFDRDRDSQREREHKQGEWERKKQASRGGAWCGARSQNAGITPCAEGRCLMTEPPRRPLPIFYSVCVCVFVCVCVLICMSVLCILDISLFSHIWFADIFSHWVLCIFKFLMVSLAVWKISVWCRSTCLFLHLLHLHLVSDPKTLCQDQSQEI